MNFAVYDTETTGLPWHPRAELERQPRIIEFGGLITDGKTVFAELEFICNPGIVIEEIITKITGLTNDDLKGRPHFNAFVPELEEFFSKADGSIAHNASFDKSMLEYDLMRVGKDLTAISFPDLVICTVEQTFHQFGRRMKLSELYELYRGPYVQKHRALDDVRLLYEIAKEIGVFKKIKEAV